MAFLRTILRGSISVDEKWTTSSTYGLFGIAPDVPDQALVDGVLARLLSFTIPGAVPSSLKTLLSNGAAITGWRVEKRGEDERILSLAEGSLGSPVGGTIGHTKTPQDAIVLSLRTATPGARGRGRMYWPALGATLGSTFQLTAPTSEAVVADAKTWLSAIGNQINSEYIAQGSALRAVLAVRSVTDHACRDVKQVQVGTVLDTQRRRRQDFRETYASVAYP